MKIYFYFNLQFLYFYNSFRTTKITGLITNWTKRCKMSFRTILLKKKKNRTQQSTAQQLYLNGHN